MSKLKCLCKTDNIMSKTKMSLQNREQNRSSARFLTSLHWSKTLRLSHSRLSLCLIEHLNIFAIYKTSVHNTHNKGLSLLLEHACLEFAQCVTSICNFMSSDLLICLYRPFSNSFLAPFQAREGIKERSSAP